MLYLITFLYVIMLCFLADKLSVFLQIPNYFHHVCSNILTMKTRVALPPPGIFQQEDVYCRKRWRQVQYLANVFWDRWRKEFLSQLQERQKWNIESRNFKVNDIVLVKDENMPRNQWPLARVTKTFPSDDGFVRTVQLHIPTSKSELQRAIHKLVLLVSVNEDEAVLWRQREALESTQRSGDDASL